MSNGGGIKGGALMFNGEDVAGASCLHLSAAGVLSGSGGALSVLPMVSWVKFNVSSPSDTES